MDVVSGIGTVIQLFQSCLKLYGDIRSVIERDADVRANSALLAAEQYKLGKLSEFLSQPSQPGILPICHLFLKPIEDDLKSVQALIVRHGKHLSPVTTGLDEDGIQNVPQRTKFRPIQIVSSIRRTGHSITWMAADKERLTELVGRLHQLIDGLSMLVTDSQRQRIEYQAMSTSIATNNVFELEELQYAALPQFPTIAQGAEVKALTLTARGRLPRELDGQDAVISSKIAFESFLWRSIAQKNLLYATDSPVYRANVEKLTLEEKAMATLDHSATQVHTRSTNGDRLQVLVEWRASFRSEESPGDFAYRLNYLVNILRQMSRRISTEDDSYERSINFGVLECIGWTTSSPNFDRIGLVFRCPANLSQTPDSLHDWIRERKKESVDLPSLGTRFDIAYGLATALFNLVSVGWTHKELRSHNVLFFDRTLPTPKLYLSGFTYARPVASLKDDLSFLNPDPVYELYRPPQNLMRQYHLSEIVQTSSYLDPRDSTSDATSFIKWTSAKDIYGLGIVLLEIGHWRTIASLKGKSSMSEFLENVLPKAVNDLSYRVGDIYRDVVSTCLHLGNWVDNDDEMREQLAEMMQKLAQCRA